MEKKKEKGKEGREKEGNGRDGIEEGGKEGQGKNTLRWVCFSWGSEGVVVTTESSTPENECDSSFLGIVGGGGDQRKVNLSADFSRFL